MRKSLVKYQRNLPAKQSSYGSYGWLVGLALVGLIVWLFTRNKGISKPIAQYSNTEEWSIEWSEGGLPTKVVIHRKATRG